MNTTATAKKNGSMKLLSSHYQIPDDSKRVSQSNLNGTHSVNSSEFIIDLKSMEPRLEQEEKRLSYAIPKKQNLKKMNET